jgi:hypothetical protein
LLLWNISKHPLYYLVSHHREQYCPSCSSSMKSTNYGAFHYSVFSNFLWLPLSSAQIYSLISCSQIPLIFFLPLKRDSRFHIPHILESNSHPFYSFSGLKNQMQIRIKCGLDFRSRAGFWKNDRASVLAFFSFKKVAKTRCRLDSGVD